MKQTQWFSREFNFSSGQNIFPSIIERLAGTPARLDEKLASIPEDRLATSVNNTWTIKENLGHLIDLEPLWQERLDDILSGKPELRPADLQNKKTNEAGHNGKGLETLLSGFRQIRKQTIVLIEGLSEEDIFKSALHPRLKTPMRTMDLFLFVAEHDDHHLATITELMKVLTQQKTDL
jgi:uncharacterized damage-inducible protein DinB